MLRDARGLALRCVVALRAPGRAHGTVCGAGLGPRSLVIEWWLMTAEGDVIGAYRARKRDGIHRNENAGWLLPPQSP